MHDNVNGIEINNILIDAFYYSTRIDTLDIESSEIVLENFTPGVNHVALKFNFHTPLKLKPQKSNLSQVVFSNSLVISIEAAHAIHQKYNLSNGFMGDYLLVYRSFTGQHQMDKARKKGFQLTYRKLNLNQKENIDLFKTVLATSEELSFKSTYQLIFNNCATSTLDVIEQIRGAPVKRGFQLSDLFNFSRGISLSSNFGTNDYLAKTGLLYKEFAKTLRPIEN